jgi:hypothetical protein
MQSSAPALTPTKGKPMARAKRKNITKNADADLFKLHDAFAKSYARMKTCNTSAADRGGGPNPTRQDQAAHRKWEHATDDAFKKARAASGPVFTSCDAGSPKRR